MKLSLVFELLLIFVLLAFAASKSVKKQANSRKSIQNRNDEDKIEEDNTVNKYCKCVEAYCNCCRDFAVPVVNLNGPGCATLKYLKGDKMSISLSFGKKVIANRTVSSRKPSPVCMPLPGGISKFCGRVYNIARAGEEFRACLGLELQSKSTVEAAVRVSCFKFGPRGVVSEPADPLPLVPQDEKVDEEEDDDDDDEDDFGLGDDDDDDDEDDDDDDGELDAENDVESPDYTGFSLLGDDIFVDIFGSSGGKKSNKNKKKQAPIQSTTSTTTKRPRTTTRRPNRRPTRVTTVRPVRITTPKIRPISRRPTRRPTRRPENSRPNRRPTTTETSSPTSSSLFTESSTKGTPVMIPVTSSIQTTPEVQISSEKDEAMAPLVSATVAQKLTPTMSVTTPNSVTDLDDPGLELSLAHITGQLSVMPVTPLETNDAKVSITPDQKQELNFEKVETITPKAPTTLAFATSSEETVNDDMIQIVHTLDSHSEETTEHKKEVTVADESRGHHYKYGYAIPSVTYEGLSLPKKKNRGAEFTMEDLDVLDLTQIGEGIGEELGIFGGKRRQQRHKDKENENKIKNGKKGSDELDDIVDTFEAIGDTLVMRKSDKGNKKEGRKRQNKMMRGWPLV